MSRYVYIMSDYTKKHIHAGSCNDVPEMLTFYHDFNQMSLHWPVSNYLNRLVYLEEVFSAADVKERLDYFTHLPLPERIKEIETINPDWIDLTTASNFDF